MINRSIRLYTEQSEDNEIVLQQIDSVLIWKKEESTIISSRRNRKTYT